MSERIEAVEVVRDEDGFFLHPSMPDWDEGTPVSEIRKWYADRGLESHLVEAQSDMDSEAYEKMVCKEQSGYANHWNPTRPDGNGWFMFGIWDTEDGPVCEWVRNKEGGE